MLATLTNTLVLAQADTGGHEEEGGSFLVSPSIGLMVWTLFLFGVSLLILWKVAFPRIAEALDRRQKAIEESLDYAARTRSEADELLAEYRERLTAARQQADDIVTRARKAAEQAEADATAHGRQRREELVEQARKDIETETRRAIQEIRAEVADLTILATEKVTRKTLTTEDQRRLVEEAVAELDFATLSGEER
jgi:F-type H+-transporting ATPase subunit b